MKKIVKQIRTLSFLFLLLIIPLTAYADDDGPEWTGIVESRPAGLTGVWIIDGLSFTSNAATQFEQEHGGLNVNACVEVNYYVSNGTNIATEISSEESYKCSGGGGGGDDDGLKTYAVIASFPAGLIGNWVIGGTTYTANANTRFEQEHGTFAIGRCVEIKYTTAYLALEIESASPYKCNSGGGGETYSQVYGPIEAFPANLIGSWTVNGVTYTADANTRFEQEYGPFFIGRCIEIKYVTGGSTAIEISAERAYKCSGGSGGANPVEQKLYGFIDAIPANPQNGTWTINSGLFVSGATTELKQEHGPFTVGTCVEVEYYDDTLGNHQASQIATEEPYKCNTNTYTNEIYELVTSFPAGLYGSWVIGDTTYDANINTQFEQEHGSFANNGCVKVKYYVQNGVNYATKLETKEANHCGGATPSFPGISKVYATIDSLPHGTGGTLTGPWIIGGVPYFAADTTQFEQEHGNFDVGVCVEAKYTANNGTNTLIKVETETAAKCQRNGSSEFKAYGIIEIMPAGGLFTGTWQVSGITYQADNATQFEQEYGFFAPGAYVEVKYTSNGGINTATRIETHVAPNGGLNTISGILITHDSNDDWAEWEVDGVTYFADPVIEVGSGSQAPIVGQAVILNTYRNNGDGNTYVTAANKAHRIFLPLIWR